MCQHYQLVDDSYVVDFDILILDVGVELVKALSFETLGRSVAYRGWTLKGRLFASRQFDD